MQLQAQGQGAAAPAQASSGRTVLLLQGLHSATRNPVEAPRTEPSTDSAVHSSPKTDRLYAALGERSGIPASCNGARGGFSGASTPVTCSRQSSFSAESLSDDAAAAVMFAAYAKGPLAVDAASVTAMPLIADAAVTYRDAEDYKLTAAGQDGCTAADHKETGTAPLNHTAEGQSSPVQYAQENPITSGAFLEAISLRDCKEVAAEYHAAQQELQPSGHAVRSPGMNLSVLQFDMT